MENEAVDIEKYNQEMVLEQRYKSLDIIQQANRALEDKANVLLQAGGVVIALVAAFGLSDLAGLVKSANFHVPPILATIALSLSFASFLISILLFRQTINPKDYHVPGDTNWSNTFDKYLSLSYDECFDQVLKDLFKAIDSALELNRSKAQQVSGMTWALLVQISALAIAVVLS
jgi:hypothetical protein